MKENYSYAALLTYEEDGTVFIEFPMFEGAVTYANKEDDPIACAQDLLSLFIIDRETENEELPDENMMPEAKDGQRIVFINVWMPYYRSQSKEAYTKKTLTIPVWLDSLAKRKNINFSAVLVKGLKKELGLNP